MTGDLESEKATIITDLSRSKSAASRSRLPLATSRIHNSARAEGAKSLSKLPSSKLQENREVKRFSERRSTISKENPKPGYAVQRSRSMLEPRTPAHRLRSQVHANADLRRISSQRSVAPASKNPGAHFQGSALTQLPEDVSTPKKLPALLSSQGSSYATEYLRGRNSLAPVGSRGITPWPRVRTKKRIRSPLVPVELRSENEDASSASDVPLNGDGLGRRLSFDTPVRKKPSSGRTRTDCLKLEALSVPRDDLFPNTMSLGSLPSQVLQHTPTKQNELLDALGFNPTDPAKKRTLWTMLDEIRLVRSDGLLSDTDSLVPEENARVVPLYQRRCNGMAPPDSPLVRRWTCLGTPAKSDLAFMVNSPTRNLANSSNHAADDETSIVVSENPILSIEEKTSAASYSWSLISVKWKPTESHLSSAGPPSTHKLLKPTQPSLLTRAHTLVRFIGSRKTSGLT